MFKRGHNYVACPITYTSIIIDLGLHVADLWPYPNPKQYPLGLLSAPALSQQAW